MIGVARVVAAAVLAAACGSCGSLPSPRFGGLRAVHRPFQFRHDIRLYNASNGMTVALLPDRRTNLVTVDARYQVGGADDPAGRAGLAHLVEHLTFAATTGADGASLADRLGEAALQYNAYTNHDVTHYTATALAGRLADVLELEAQRLELSCAQLDDAVFSRERDVVLEEEAERRTAAGELRREIARVVWGERHPYARGVGTREVADATKAEACAFFHDHYAPERLILVVTGDFDPDQAAAAIGARFGRVTRRGTIPRAAIADARLAGTRSRHRADVDDASAFVMFPAPPWGGPDAVLYELALERLGQVMRRADHERTWITGVRVGADGGGRGRVVTVEVTVDDPGRLDAAVDEVLARAPGMFAELGPHQIASMIGRAQTGYVASYESFASRGEWLADFLTFTRHDGLMIPELQALAEVTVGEADRYARARFVRDRSHVALVEPSGKPPAAGGATIASGREPDLVPWRAAVDPDEARHPLTAPTTRVRERVDELTLGNGLRVLLAPDPTSSMVDARLVFPHGSAADPPGRRGRASAAANLLAHDLDHRFRPGVAFLLGWALGAGTQLAVDVDEGSTVFAARGTANVGDWHVWRLSWLLDQGVYTDADVEQLRHDAARERDDDARPAAGRVLQLLFGAGHPYATTPPRGAAWSWLTTGELERHRRTHYVPRGATLIITGGFEVAAMREVVESLFGPWADRPGDPPVTVPAAQPVTGPHWVGTRHEARAQIGLMVAFTTTSDPDHDRAARLVLLEMVRDRLRFVREGLGASYGVDASYLAGLGGGALRIETQLDPDRAEKAATALLAELERLRTGAATLREDFVRARRRALASSLADAAGVTAVADELTYTVRRGRPLDDIDRLAAAIGAVTPADVAAVASVDLAPARRVVSVAATAERLDAIMAALGATEPALFDAK